MHIPRRACAFPQHIITMNQRQNQRQRARASTSAMNPRVHASASDNAELQQLVEYGTQWIKSFATNHREHVDDEDKKHLEEVRVRGARGVNCGVHCCAQPCGAIHARR